MVDVVDQENYNLFLNGEPYLIIDDLSCPLSEMCKFPLGSITVDPGIDKIFVILRDPEIGLTDPGLIVETLITSSRTIHCPACHQKSFAKERFIWGLIVFSLGMIILMIGIREYRHRRREGYEQV